MDAYFYCADIYCEDCGRAIKKRIRKEGNAPADPRDETSYDSDEYPKGPYDDGGGESDSPEHCGSGADCINALELSDGTKVGCWLENPLTSDGARYVAEAVKEGGEVSELWAEWYKEEISHICKECGHDSEED
jgi:hypothetical protein